MVHSPVLTPTSSAALRSATRSRGLLGDAARCGPRRARSSVRLRASGPRCPVARGRQPAARAEWSREWGREGALPHGWQAADAQDGRGALRVAEAPGVYRPRRPEKTAFYRLIAGQFDRYVQVHEERFAPRAGPLRRVVPEAVGEYLARSMHEGSRGNGMRRRTYLDRPSRRSAFIRRQTVLGESRGFAGKAGPAGSAWASHTRAPTQPANPSSVAEGLVQARSLMNSPG